MARRPVSPSRTQTARVLDLAQFPENGVLTLRQANIQTICCIPLVTRHGALGTLNVGRRSPEVCSPDEVDLLVDVARQVAIALENMLAFREIWTSRIV